MDKNQPGIRQNYPKDLLRNLPPKQEGKMLKNPKFSAFALSLPGASHIRKGVPCQDYSDIRILEGCGIIIAGIADGVGSCPLSHWGAYIAVNEALGYVESQILRQEAALGEGELRIILDQAFHHAEDMVARAADAAEQAVRNLQSTLTVAVYDGSNLYCCHVGDDGVVAQQRNGIVKLATNRLKGEEASSVYPLQTGKWEITKTENAVAGFVMATDGILDAFALMFPDHTNINYFNHIYYPFMEPAMYEMLDRTVPDAVGKTLDFYRNYLNSSGYREKVTDDLTLIAVAAPAVLAKSVRPEFSKDIWNEIERENEQKKAEALGYSVLPDPILPDPVPPNLVPQDPVLPHSVPGRRLKLIFAMFTAAVIVGVCLFVVKAVFSAPKLITEAESEVSEPRPTPASSAETLLPQTKEPETSREENQPTMQEPAWRPETESNFIRDCMGRDVIYILNESGKAIVGVYIFGAASDSWGENRLSQPLKNEEYWEERWAPDYNEGWNLLIVEKGGSGWQFKELTPDLIVYGSELQIVYQDNDVWANIASNDTRLDGAVVTSQYVNFDQTAPTQSEYILPDSDRRYYSESELAGLTDGELRIARLEIYARHGRKFTDPALQSYFDSCSWYHGTIEASEFDEEKAFNLYEKANRNLIRKMENR